METSPQPAAPEDLLRIWVMTDGRAGNLAQALGLAEALARLRPAAITVRRIEPKPWAACLPARLWHLAGARQGGWPFSGYLQAVSPPWPELAIGAGRRVAPLLAALRTLFGVKAVQILDPRLPAAAFDLLVVPEHDRPAAPNAVTMLGAVGRVTPARIAADTARWCPRLAHLPKPRVACLIGGPTKSAAWRDGDSSRLVNQLAALSRSGRGLMITPSRRSDPAVIAGIKAACAPAPVFVWDGIGDNPYPGILGLATAVVVTSDSVNMVSEAASSGLPLHVFRIWRESAKLRAFHRTLAERGIARDFNGKIEAWSYAALAETDRVAGEIAQRIL